DDEPGGNPGSAAAGSRRRSGRSDAAAPGDHGDRRPHRKHAFHTIGDPGGVSGAGKEKGKGSSGPAGSCTCRSGLDCNNRRIDMSRVIARMGMGALRTAVVALPLYAVSLSWAADPTLEMVQTIELKGKAGKLDHLIVDS